MAHQKKDWNLSMFDHLKSIAEGQFFRVHFCAADMNMSLAFVE